MLCGSAISVIAEEKGDVFEVGYVQTSNVVDGKYMIRFVGLSSMTDVTAGMSIRVWETENGTTLENFNSSVYKQKTPIKTFYTAECDIYDELEGHAERGIESYKANDYGAEKFFAVAIDNVQAGTAYTFEVTPFYSDAYGETVGTAQYLLFNEKGIYINDLVSGFADSVAWNGESMYTYTVMSTNVLGKYSGDTAQDATTEARMKIIGDYVKTLMPDSRGVQEYGARNKAFLPEYLPSEYASVSFSPDWVATFYNSAKFSVEAKNCIRLTTVSNQNYCFTWVVFRHKDGDLAYIHGNLHLEYKNTATRITNAEEVNDEISRIFANSQYASLPLVITGDYNAKLEIEPAVFSTIAGNYNIRCASEVALAADSGQASFHELGVSSGAGMALDHILVNCDTTEALTHDIIKQDDYAEIVNASDHYPVVVKFIAKQ